MLKMGLCYTFKEKPLVILCEYRDKVLLFNVFFNCFEDFIKTPKSLKIKY